LAVTDEAGFVYQCCAAARRLRRELSLLPARHGERPLAALYNLQDDNALKKPARAARLEQTVMELIEAHKAQIRLH
jgi:hypothetical protein